MAGVQSVVKLTSRLGGKVFSNLGVVSPACSTSRNYSIYSKEPSQPVDNTPKVCSAEDAVKCIKSGDTVFVGGAAATPIHLVNAMTDHGKGNKLKGVTVCHMHTEGEAPYVNPDCEGIFRSLSFFMAANVRKSVAEGRSDCIPIFLKEIPYLFFKGIVKPDVALVHVSPPDQHGYVSLGTSVDCVRAGLSHSKIAIAQVNPRMPRTFGESLVHISHFDYIVNVDTPLPEHGGKTPSPQEDRIGKYIAEELVEDGATLQLGIGNIPDSVLSKLGKHKDLGVHSEMFSVGLVDLMKNGAVTNNKKEHNKGVTVGSFMIGTKKLYDYVDNNPAISMREVHYVNGSHQISRNPKMTAINSCIEIDLTGQVVSDSIGTRMYSGFGGQVDFIRGAGEGYDGKGKPIIALASTSAKGVSKIVPYIKEGAGVVTTRAHVQYVVTEYGIAYLFGKSLRQRAYELIKIAHPDRQQELEKAAFERLKVMPSP